MAQLTLHMKHITDTTLPLKVGQLNRGHGHYSYAVLDDTGKPIAEGFTDPHTPILIVKAVNNHQQLINAVERAIPALWLLAAGNQDAAKRHTELLNALQQARKEIP